MAKTFPSISTENKAGETSKVKGVSFMHIFVFLVLSCAGSYQYMCGVHVRGTCAGYMHSSFSFGRVAGDETTNNHFSSLRFGKRVPPMTTFSYCAPPPFPPMTHSLTVHFVDDLPLLAADGPPQRRVPQLLLFSHAQVVCSHVAADTGFRVLRWWALLRVLCLQRWLGQL